MKHDGKPTEPMPAMPASAGPAPPRRIDIRDLLGGGRELRILHDGQEYRLSLTSKGKLILTK